MTDHSRQTAESNAKRQATWQEPAVPVFRRSEANPIRTAQDMPFRTAALLNPGTAEYQGKVVLLLRVEDITGYSSLYIARSDDGLTGWEIAPQPLFTYGDPDHPYEAWGCEDGRITFVPGENRYYITYIAYSSMGPAVALARTEDFQQVEPLGAARLDQRQGRRPAATDI